MKNLWISLSLLALLNVSKAEDIAVETNEGKIQIVAADCETLKKQVTGILKWKEKFPKEKSFNPNVKFENTSSGCSADISSILPKFALEWHEKEGKIDGPNCWNTALYMSGVVDEVRFTNDQEFSFWMNSPLCKELDQNEPVQPGDLIVERGEAGEHHVSVAISDDLIFEKIGFEKFLGYQLTNKPDMTPETTLSGGRFCGRTKGQRPNECTLGWYNYYRCQSMDDYLKKNPESDLGEFAKMNKTLNQIECNMQEQIKNSGIKSLDSFSDNVLAVIQDQAIAESKKSSKDFLWKSLVHRVNSLRSQINITKKSRN